MVTWCVLNCCTEHAQHQIISSALVIHLCKQVSQIEIRNPLNLGDLLSKLRTVSMSPVTNVQKRSVQKFSYIYYLSALRTHTLSCHGTLVMPIQPGAMSFYILQKMS
jgi:hypothetical protein